MGSEGGNTALEFDLQFVLQSKCLCIGRGRGRGLFISAYVVVGHLRDAFASHPLDRFASASRPSGFHCESQVLDALESESPDE